MVAHNLSMNESKQAAFFGVYDEVVPAHTSEDSDDGTSTNVNKDSEMVCGIWALIALLRSL